MTKCAKFYGQKNDGPPLDIYYLKPVIVCVPSDFIPAKEFVCNCGKPISHHGWTDPRYVHSIKTGKYLVQRRYICSNSSCSLGTFTAVKCLELNCIPDCVRLLFPIVEKHNSVLDDDFVSYVTVDALTGMYFFL